MPSRPESSVVRVALAYTLMIAATVVIFRLSRALGGTLQAPSPTGLTPFGSAAGGQKVDIVLHVLVALAVVIITARVLGAVFKHLGQPILHLLTRERPVGREQGAEGEQTAS